MSQAEELLNNMVAAAAVPTPVPSDDRIVIDNHRFVHVPESLQRLGVQYDHEIETVTFRAPRYWDGRDLSTMRIYINYMRADGVRGQHMATNVQIDSVSGMLTFDWTISNHVTQIKGKIAFLVCAVTTDITGNETRHWNSELNQECYISEGLECDDFILDTYPDIITQLLLRMDEVEALAATIPRIFHVVDDMNGTITLEATFEEMVAAYDSGCPIIVVLEEREENFVTVIGTALCSCIGSGTSSTFFADFIDPNMMLRTISIRSGGCTSDARPIASDDSSTKTCYVTVTDNGDMTGTPDRTYEEIMEAYEAGCPVIVILSQETGEYGPQILGTALCFDMFGMLCANIIDAYGQMWAIVIREGGCDCASVPIASGGSGIHIGPEPPTDPNVNYWVDTDEDPPESGGGGGADWNANEGEPGYVKNRTHYRELAELLPETTVLFDEENGGFVFDSNLTFTEGETYVVKWNGVEYTCVAWSFSEDLGEAGIETLTVIGNKMLIGEDDTGEPFVFANSGALMAIPYEESTEVTASISAYQYRKIPMQYLPTPVHWIDAVRDGDTYTGITVTPAQTTEAVASGQEVKLRIHYNYQKQQYIDIFPCVTQCIAPEVSNAIYQLYFRERAGILPTEKTIALMIDTSAGIENIDEILNLPWVVTSD